MDGGFAAAPSAAPPPAEEIEPLVSDETFLPTAAEVPHPAPAATFTAVAPAQMAQVAAGWFTALLPSAAPSPAEQVGPRPASSAAPKPPSSAAPAAPANAPASDSPVDAECPVCMEPCGPGHAKQSKAWPAACQHIFCADCWEGCIDRDLRCPMCRTEAPEEARPITRRQQLLTAMQILRLQELIRLDEERATSATSARQPRTRVGRWVQRRGQAIDRMLDNLLDL